MFARKEMCKLCLKYIETNDELVTLHNEILIKLEFLQIDLGKHVEGNSFICLDCHGKIENVANFKSSLQKISESTGPGNKTKIPTSSTNASCSKNSICHLCKHYIDEPSVISLFKLLKDDIVMNMFQKHLQEVDLEKIVDSSMICKVCEISLGKFSSLVASRLISNDHSHSVMKEENCNVEMQQDNKNNLNLSVINSVMNNATIKEELSDEGHLTNNEDGDCRSDSVIYLCEVVKKEEIEENEEVEMEDMQLKNEELEIKNDDESAVNHAKRQDSHEGKTCKGHIYKCRNCSFETKYKQSLKTHMLQHTSANELPIFNCETCPFRTKYKGNFKKHLIKHKSVNELPIYNCEKCPYGTNYIGSLKKHMIKHSSLNALLIYNCQKCPYGTNINGNLKKHMVTHISANELPIFNCEKCPYRTKYKKNVKRHMIIHKSVNEYNCERCSFQTNYESTWKKHVLKTKCILYNCAKRSHETIDRDCLKIHMQNVLMKLNISQK